MNGSTAAPPTTQPIEAQTADEDGGRSVWPRVLGFIIGLAAGTGIFLATWHFGQRAVNVIFIALLVALLLDRCQLANHIDEARADADQARDDAAKARTDASYAHELSLWGRARTDGIVAHLTGQELPGEGRHAKGPQ